MGGADPAATTWAGLTAAAVLLVPFVPLDLPNRPPGAAPLAAMAVLAAVCTALALLLHNHMIVAAGPARASLVAYLAPPFAVGYGAAVLGEGVGVPTGAGLVLVLAGSWLTVRSARPVSGTSASTRPPAPVAGCPRLLAYPCREGAPGWRHCTSSSSR